MNSSKAKIFDDFEIELINDCYYKITLHDDCIFSYNELNLLIETQIAWGEKKRPVMIICGEYSNTDTEFLKHLGKNVNDPYSIADAFVLKSLSQRFLAKFYFKFVKPERPTEFFKKEEDALNWLQQFIR